MAWVARLMLGLALAFAGRQPRRLLAGVVVAAVVVAVVQAIQQGHPLVAVMLGTPLPGHPITGSHRLRAGKWMMLVETSERVRDHLRRLGVAQERAMSELNASALQHRIAWSDR